MNSRQKEIVDALGLSDSDIAYASPIEDSIYIDLYNGSELFVNYRGKFVYHGVGTRGKEISKDTAMEYIEKHKRLKNFI